MKKILALVLVLSFFGMTFAGQSIHGGGSAPVTDGVSAYDGG